MKKLTFLFVVVTALELWAFQTHSHSPIMKPGYFNALMQCIQLAVCLGGVEAARWLLRRSPVARREGPESEWNKLWLWLGPPGGLLFCVGCLLGKLAYQLVDNRFAGPIVVSHMYAGAVAWAILGIWAFPEVVADPKATGGDKLLLLLGVALHMLGFGLFASIYPAVNILQALGMLVTILFYFFSFFFYYVWIAVLVWGFVFKFWPGSATGPVLSERALEQVSEQVAPPEAGGSLDGGETQSPPDPEAGGV